MSVIYYKCSPLWPETHGTCPLSSVLAPGRVLDSETRRSGGCNAGDIITISVGVEEQSGPDRPCSPCVTPTAPASPACVTGARYSSVSLTSSQTVCRGVALSTQSRAPGWWWGPRLSWQTTTRWRTPSTGGDTLYFRWWRETLWFLQLIFYSYRIHRFQVNFYQKYLIPFWYKRSVGKTTLTRLSRQHYLCLSQGNIISKLCPRKVLSSPGRRYTPSLRLC